MTSQRKTYPTQPCIRCSQHIPHGTAISARTLRARFADFVAARHPATWHVDGILCRRCIDIERAAYIMLQLEEERGELSTIEHNVSRKAATHLEYAAHIDTQFEKNLTFGQRLADTVASVGGSWPFVIGFMLVLIGWIILNTAILRTAPFDPYPYILLNLVLSCLAALQAPIIMMSQNRAAARDRLEADEDFKINLKAELEIAALHEKMDHLLHTQWERMVELQQTQLDLLEELLEKPVNRSHAKDTSDA